MEMTVYCYYVYGGYFNNAVVLLKWDTSRKKNPSEKSGLKTSQVCIVPAHTRHLLVRCIGMATVS